MSPSSLPSDEPTLSSAPSSVPSDEPSSSPSSLPSDEPSVSARPSSTPSDLPSSSMIPSASPSDGPSPLPSFVRSDEPSASFRPSLGPSSNPSMSHEPSLVPSDVPSDVPSSLPSRVPSQLPSQLPTQLPSPEPSAIPSLMPSSSPSSIAQTAGDGSTSPPTKICTTTLYTEEFLNNGQPDPNFGNLLSCGSDEDCGGMGIIDPITGELVSHGAKCDRQTCQCVCDAEYCLAREDQQADDDTSCKFQCECRKKCSLPGNWTGAADATALDRCTNECTLCVDNPGARGEDEDCIDGVCVESGMCTAQKEAMCDDGYAAVSGKKNQRAKCCPDTRYVDRWFLFDLQRTLLAPPISNFVTFPLCL